MASSLPSWKNGFARSSILDFVTSVTTPGERFVPPAERIATFDNDGTLWCEKPTYAQADFILRRWAEMVKDDPGRATEQPFKAVAEGDHAWLSALEHHIPELLAGIGAAFGGITTTAFEQDVARFFATVRHPTLGCPYNELGYRPMRELLDLLGANDFRVFICSGGGRDFVRVVADEMYGIPRERVIGSGSGLEYRDGAVYRTEGVEQPIDDGPGKPVHIWMRTGRAPLFAAGNADGDIAMLESARFSLLVHHDDDVREFAYDTGAEQALVASAERGWTVASMRDDWATIFGPDHGET